MHELGHNLFLRHGGDKPTNKKPNYPSVMSYLYQFPGVSTDCDTSSDGSYDYSYGLFANLDETSLDEGRGICDGVAQDWNGAGGSGQTGVQANINGDKVKDYDDNGLNSDLFNASSRSRRTRQASKTQERRIWPCSPKTGNGSRSWAALLS